jgi:hypothetical protein
MSAESGDSLIRIDVCYWIGTINSNATMEHVTPLKVTNRSIVGNSVHYTVLVDAISPTIEAVFSVGSGTMLYQSFVCM